MTMTWDSIQQFVRIALGWAGAYLVGKGIVDQTNSDILVGGLLAVVQVGWWLFWNKRRAV